jgi:hypothetical protein
MSSPLRLSTDLKEFVKSLSSHEVEFLVAGAHAVAFHGRARFTEDLDLFLSRTDENQAKLAKALEDFGFPIDHVQLEKFFQNPRAMIKLGVKPNLVELLNFLDGVSFDEAYSRCDRGLIGETEVGIISLEDLLSTKETVGRPQDLADLAVLRKIHNLDQVE